MYAQFFGNYLLEKNIVTREQLVDAMKQMASERIKLGSLAIHEGYMTASEVDNIVILQTHQDKRFGELAVQEGYLTENQVTELLQKQFPSFLLLGQTLVDQGLIDNTQLEDLIVNYQSHNEIYDLDYSDETKENIDRLIDSFFLVTERSLSELELSFLHLLFNNLLRFIGDDFTPVAPSVCREYPTSHCVSQQITGEFSVKIYLDIPENAAVEFASRYAGEDFTEFDEYVEASLEDFLNLHNGLFNVNASNMQGIELQLEPPILEEKQLLTFQNEAYLFPIIYSFGMVYFVIEICKSK
ncbi:MAG: chemotaxis protein CheX [Roseburia sp.]